MTRMFDWNLAIFILYNETLDLFLIFHLVCVLFCFPLTLPQQEKGGIELETYVPLSAFVDIQRKKYLITAGWKWEFWLPTCSPPALW